MVMSCQENNMWDYEYNEGYEYKELSHLSVVDTLSLLAIGMMEEGDSTVVAGNSTIAPPAVIIVVSMEDEKIPGMRVGTCGAAMPRARAR